jgi:hypothetical protein
MLANFLLSWIKYEQVMAMTSVTTVTLRPACFQIVNDTVSVQEKIDKATAQEGFTN